jgi:hypothetical protein
MKTKAWFVVYSAQGAKRRFCRRLALMCSGGSCGVALTHVLPGASPTKVAAHIHPEYR